MRMRKDDGEKLNGASIAKGRNKMQEGKIKCEGAENGLLGLIIGTERAKEENEGSRRK